LILIPSLFLIDSRRIGLNFFEGACVMRPHNKPQEDRAPQVFGRF